LRTLRYDDGKLDIEMALASAASLDALQQHIAETGLQAQVMDKHEAGSGVNIQLRISAGGAK
jgi:hypothetical protein